MTFYEIQQELQKKTPEYRIYDVRQIESMREAIPAYAVAASYAESKLILEKAKLVRVHSVMDKLRKEGNYAASDAIRDALK